MQDGALVLTQCRHGRILPWFSPISMRNEVRSGTDFVPNVTERQQMRLELCENWVSNGDVRYPSGTPPVVQFVFLPLPVGGSSAPSNACAAPWNPC